MKNLEAMIEEEVQGRIAEFPIYLSIADGELELSDIDYTVEYSTGQINITIQHDTLIKDLQDARSNYETMTGSEIPLERMVMI